MNPIEFNNNLHLPAEALKKNKIAMTPIEIRDEIDKTKDEIIELLWKTVVREILPARMPKGILKLKDKLASLEQQLEKEGNTKFCNCGISHPKVSFVDKCSICGGKL